MPNCVKCNSSQARLNKGDLCKICKTCSSDNEPLIENAFNDNTTINSMLMDNDRSIIDLIKSHMLKESQWSNETNLLLKEQIEYLKDEIKHKNGIIENLIKTKSLLPSNNVTENRYLNKDDALSINDSSTVNGNIINNDHVIISPDNSLSANGVEYKNTEKDDVFYCDDNNTEWITDNKGRKSDEYSQHYNKSVQHPNRFSGLYTNDNAIYDTINDVNKEYIHEGVKAFKQLNSKKQSNKRTRPHIVIQDYPENNFIKKPIRPGNNMYNQAVKDGKTTVVFSTSITKGIKVRDFNKQYSIGTARFRRFPGAKTKQIKHYVVPTLVDESPQVVLLQCGGNDLPTTKMNPTPVEDIAKEIIETAKICENQGVEQILISGIVTRKQEYMDRRRKQLNNLLQDMCYDLGYIYIDNDNITHDHLFNDGVHLNFEGSDILSNNFLHSLNNIF